MSNFFIAPIVEGHGEVQAVPVLLQRILQSRAPQSSLRINPPLRVKAASFLNDAEYLKKYVELAALKARGHENGSVLILLDCEDNCPAQIGPDLAAKARAVRSDVPVTVALAYREYETWFLAAARSLRGSGGLPSDLEPPPIPEIIRDAKGWLRARMPAPYNEPNHQRDFTSTFSLEEASVVPSFSRFHRKISDLFSA
jgi:hypothetical protein